MRTFGCRINECPLSGPELPGSTVDANGMVEQCAASFSTAHKRSGKHFLWPPSRHPPPLDLPMGWFESDESQTGFDGVMGRTELTVLTPLAALEVRVGHGQHRVAAHSRSSFAQQQR